MISNNVPTTAPLITATLTESSSLSLDATVARVNNYKIQVSYLAVIGLIPISGLTGSSTSSAMPGVTITRVYDDVTVADGVGTVVWTV